MKSSIVTILFLIVFLLSQAQITITQNDMPFVGFLSALVKDTSPVSITPGGSGPGQTWDLSILSAEDTSGASFIDPAGAAGGSNFPGANLAIPDSINNAATFFNLSSSKFDLHGVYTDFGYGSTAVKFNPVETWLTIPSGYQSSFIDQAKYQITIPYSNPPIDSVRIKTTINYTSIIDGWGAITTPDFTNINCLRQKFTEISIDSTFVHYYGIWAAAGSPTIDTTITYRWWTNKTRIFIAEVTTDPSGTVSSASYLINTSAYCTLSASTSSTDETGFSYNNGAATITPSGGITPYIYYWSNGATTATASGLSPGTYYVTVTDAINCSVSDTVVISPYVCSFFISATSTDETSYNGNNGTATVLTIGGTSPFTYEWNNGSDSATINNLSPGTYYITVSDNKGCVAEDSTVVSGYVCSLSLSVSSTNETAQGANNGTASATASGGTTPYIYEWNTGAATATINNLSPGIYFVSITDAANCMVSGNAIVNGGGCTLIIDSLSVINNSCFGDSTGAVSSYVSGGTSPYAYNWTNGSNQSQITNLIPNTYAVTISDAAGCFVTGSVVVSQPAVLSTTASKIDISCFGFCNGSASVSASGGTSPYSHLWSTGSLQEPVNVCAGTYIVTVTDANGCNMVDSAIITEPDSISLSFSSTNTTCGVNNGTATVSASGGAGSFTYLWDSFALNQTTASATGLSSGTYAVSVSDTNNCLVAGSVTVGNTSGLNVTMAAVNVNCYGESNGSATAQVTGGTSPYTFLWNTVPVQSTATATGLSPGTYMVTVSDSASCTFTQSVSISEPADVNIISTVSDAQCFGLCNGDAVVSATGGTPPYTYLWDIFYPPVPGAWCAGNYNVSVTDSNGCTDSAAISIGQPPMLSLVLQSTPDSGNAEGTATVFATGGIPPYSYLWNTNPAQTDSSAFGLSSGYYVVSVTDSNLCSDTGGIFVDLFVGINSNTFSSGLSVFPNPFREEIRLMANISEGQKVQIFMINSLGREQLLLSEKKNKRNFDLTFDLKQFPSGVYFLKLLVDGEVEYIRIVKMR